VSLEEISIEMLKEDDFNFKEPSDCEEELTDKGRSDEEKKA